MSQQSLFLLRQQAEEDVTMEEKAEGCNMAGFDDGRRDHESRNASERPLEAGKAKETNDQLQPANTFILAQ